MRSADFPLVPVRMLNEHVYCPRLAYLMWVQGEFAHNEFTVEGAIRHERVDAGGGLLPAQPGEDTRIHARSVYLSSEQLGITARIDLVEGEGSRVTPVDYKRGVRPHVAGGAYEPERVQVCAQGLLLREHGFECEQGILYFAGSRERVRIPIDEELIARTRSAIEELKTHAASGVLPPPLEDSPKCPRCSLVGICLPDEMRLLSHLPVKPRPIFPSEAPGLPLYIESPRAFVCKDGERLVIEEAKKRVAAARLGEISQVVLFGYASLTTAVIHECMRREIPVTWLTYGGWFLGHTVGTGHRNVETRTRQYQRSFDPDSCRHLARRWVVAKIANCRTLLRRNWRGEGEDGKAPA
ncbi:MAG: CRISPR-associated protein Cas4, partial [Syntrophobacteraceae bacterium]|nr:CRISPR-associated protein Cas4 [Syntrophobacteraceae bacterium]